MDDFSISWRTHMLYGYDEDMPATPADAMREYAWNVGADERNIDRQWLLTDYDVWVRNPHYTGPEQRHPEDDSDWTVDDQFDLLAEHVADAMENGDYVQAVPNENGEWEDDVPF